MRSRQIRLLLIVLIVSIAIAWAASFTSPGHRVLLKLRGGSTVAQRIEQCGEKARRRWHTDFEAANVNYPPATITFVAIKSDRLLHVYCDNRFIRTIRVLGQSGELGPKRKAGDDQVPEGIYGIESLNPNSRFHLSLRIDYPNAVDRSHAAPATDLGGDIMIHGGSSSVGCIAVGDEAAEDLFVLVHDAGLPNVKVLLSPVDFRTTIRPATDELEAVKYEVLHAAFSGLPLPAASLMKGR